MPNYRYNIPEYGYGNSYRNCPQSSVSSTQRQPHHHNSVQNPPSNSGCVTRETRDIHRKQHSHELEDMPLAMAYVPWQKWCSIHKAEHGFCHGTIFKELDRPFRGIGGVC